ncbi:MAB_1171c family putative transporter [Streptomyces sp. NPDC021212]|uniref:MAB_1171c family putative transporter n=1 Tax=Streptomyces sp. NPDC021212 TaxID=3365118 RepID=UPI0037AA403E
METMAIALFLTVLAAAVAWKLYQLYQAPRDASLRSLTLCLVCIACSYLFAMPDGSPGFDHIASHNVAKLMQNVLLLATSYFLMCFYLHSVADKPVSRRRARREAAAMVIVTGVITVAATTAPGEAIAVGFKAADMTNPPVAVFYLGAGLYMLYTLATASWWTRRYARVSRRPHATGLWLVAAGLTGMAFACATRAIFIVIRASGGSVADVVTSSISLVLMVSIAAFIIGVTYRCARSRLDVFRVWRRHRRIHRQLQPLWELLSEAFPEYVMEPSSASWRDRWSARGVHRRYTRRWAECRDCLVRLSPYLLAHAPGSATLDSTPPDVLAARLRDAAYAASRGVAVQTRAMPVAAPHHEHRDDDVLELVALSNALRETA